MTPDVVRVSAGERHGAPIVIPRNVRWKHQTWTNAAPASRPLHVCDTAGVTKAHVFAESWTGLCDEPDDTREHEVVHRYVDPSTGKQREIKRATTFALKSRKVCGTCNSGWLSQLEERVRSLMTAFAQNTPMILNNDEQADLALWATAASLIAMAMDPEARGFACPTLAQEIARSARQLAWTSGLARMPTASRAGSARSRSTFGTSGKLPSKALGARRSPSATPLSTSSATTSRTSGFDSRVTLTGLYVGSGVPETASFGRRSSSCARTTSARWR